MSYKFKFISISERSLVVIKGYLLNLRVCVIFVLSTLTLLLIVLFPPFSLAWFVVCIILVSGKINCNERRVYDSYQWTSFIRLVSVGQKSDIVELPGILDIPRRYLTLAPG